MLALASREVQNHYGEFVETVQDDVVCVTRHGRPLYWALSERHLRASDPSVLIGRLLLLRGQLERQAQAQSGQTGVVPESLTQMLRKSDAQLQTAGLSEKGVAELVRANRL